MIDALLQKNILPDWLIRIGIRRLLRQRLAEEESNDNGAKVRRFAEELRQQPIAVNTADGLVNLSVEHLTDAEKHFGLLRMPTCLVLDDRNSEPLIDFLESLKVQDLRIVQSDRLNTHVDDVVSVLKAKLAASLA